MNTTKKVLGAGFAAVAAMGLSLGTATTAQAEMVGPVAPDTPSRCQLVRVR